MKQIPHHGTMRPWKGCSLNELLYRQALNNARIITEKERINREISDLRTRFTTPATSDTLVGRLFGSLNYLDWITLGVGAYRKLAPLFHRHKSH